MRDLIAARVAEIKRSGKRIRRCPLPPPVLRIERQYAAHVAAIVARDIQAAIDYIAKGYERIRAASQTAAVTDSTESAIDSLFHYVRLMLPNKDKHLRDLATAQATTLNARNAGWVRESVETLIGIDPLQSEPWLAEQIGLHVAESMTLIKSARGKAIEDIQALVMRSVRSGESTAKLVDKMLDIRGVAASRAKLIARDQTGKLLGNLTRIRMQDLGVDRYQWSTSLDERVRPMHKALEGTEHTWDRPPVTNVKGERNNPGQDIQCRCSALFIF